MMGRVELVMALIVTVLVVAFWSFSSRAAPCLEHPTGPFPVATGGPFTDCGMGPVGFRSPSPTTYPHSLSDGDLLSQSSICLQPFTAQSWWWGQPDLPDIYVNGSDRVVHNAAIFPGDVIFTGERIQWFSQPGFGAVTGEYRCAMGAREVEVDGECLCPVPEPGLAGLFAGVIAIAATGRRTRGASEHRRRDTRGG